MRKILLILIVVMLIALGVVSLTKGIEISNFKILSIKQIQEENNQLKAKIDDINTLIDTEYPKKISEVKTAANNMNTAKSEYLKYTNLSSDTEILGAMQVKSYAIEFLWLKIGNHATKEGVNLKIEIIPSGTGSNNSSDLKFTVEGSYIGITNFIYSIEDDKDLNFRIQNFKLLPSNQDILQGTFTVRNISIQGNTSTQNVKTNTQENTTNTNTANPANKTSTNSENTNAVQ